MPPRVCEHGVTSAARTPQDFLLGATASAQGIALSFVKHVRYK